jgi:hypothetical protein
MNSFKLSYHFVKLFLSLLSTRVCYQLKTRAKNKSGNGSKNKDRMMSKTKIGLINKVAVK